MEWDLGIQGVGVALVVALGFGLVAQFVGGRSANRWLWLITTATCFVVGLFTSEVLFGSATEEDLQPNIDGLSFDEVLLSSLLTAILTIVVTRYAVRHAPVRSVRGHHR